MTALPIKKLLLPADHAFGPLSGLGALEYGPFGAARPVLASRLALPIALPAPFLWELHLTTAAELCHVTVTLEGAAPGAEPLTAVLRPRQKTEVIGSVHATPDRAGQAMTFRFGPQETQGKLWFLALSLLPIGAWAAA